MRAEVRFDLYANVAVEPAAVELRARRQAHGAVRGRQRERGVRQREAAELRLAELQLAARIDRAQHLERQVDLVERALLGRSIGFLRRRQIAVDVDVVDGKVVGDALAFERDAARQRRVVERELHVAQPDLARVVEQVRFRARARQHGGIVGGLHVDFEALEHLARRELADVDGARQREIAHEPLARQRARHRYSEEFERETVQLERLVARDSRPATRSSARLGSARRASLRRCRRR